MRLLATSAEDTGHLLQEYVEEARAITDQIYEICWYMRGGVEREGAWQLSNRERQRIMKLIGANIERTNKTGLPLL
jgi:hypothetical protein